MRLSALPTSDTIAHHVPWEGSFDDRRHRVTSSSCHIYTAQWGNKPIVLKCMKEERSTSDLAQSEFEMEAAALARLQVRGNNMNYLLID